MRRKTIGFLALMLIVAVGVVFVETRVRDADKQRVWKRGSSSLYRVVLGGTTPDLDPADSLIAPSVDLPNENLLTQELPAPDPQPVTVPRPPPVRDPPRAFHYRVSKGDTLGQIVKDHLGSASAALVRRVALENGISDTNAIVPGSLLTISLAECERHESVSGESLRDLASRFYGKPDRTSPLRKANPDLPTLDTVPLREGLVVWVPR